MNRHHRQQILPQIGEAGQQRLRDSHALIVGLGALGTVIAESLTRAGVGALTLIDRDVVELTNLQRQTLYTEADAQNATPKPLAAKARLNQIDSATQITTHCEDLSPDTAPELIGFSDPPLPEGEGLGEREDRPHLPNLLLDATDNFETRYLINDIAVSQSIPAIFTGAVATTATLFTYLPRRTPCLRCLFPDLPAPGSEPTCETAGVLAPAAGAIANLAAAEAIKLLSGNADQANPNLIHLDAWAPSTRAIDLSNAKDLDCPCCARRRFDFLDAAAGEVVPLCGRRSVQIAPAARAHIELKALADRLTPFGDFTATPAALTGAFRDETGEFGPITLHVFPTGRAIVGNTTDPARAKTIYSRFIGV